LSARELRALNSLTGSSITKGTGCYTAGHDALGAVDQIDTRKII
jgi:hypothetical protein